MYVIFFDSKGPVLQIPVPRGTTEIAKFYRNVAFTKIEKDLPNPPPQNWTQAPQTPA